MSLNFCIIIDSNSQNIFSLLSCTPTWPPWRHVKTDNICLVVARTFARMCDLKHPPRFLSQGLSSGDGRSLGWESSGDVVAESSLCIVLSRSQARVATCFVWNGPCCRPWRFTFTSLGCFTHFYSWATFVARNVRRLPRSPGSICQVTTF